MATSNAGDAWREFLMLDSSGWGVCHRRHRGFQGLNIWRWSTKHTARVGVRGFRVGGGDDGYENLHGVGDEGVKLAFSILT